MIDVYNIEIQRIQPNTEIPLTRFKVKEHKVNDTVLEILIKYSSSEEPKFEGLLDEANQKFYLVGGGTDNPVRSEERGAVCFTMAKSNQVWLHLDLSKLGKVGEITILKMTPPIYKKGNQLSDAKEDVLMKIVA